MRRASVALLAAVVLAGCGSEPASDAEQIQEVLDDYHAATVSRDAELLCTEVMAAPPASLEQCIRDVRLVMGDPEFDLGRPDELRPLAEPKIEGDRATLRVADDGKPQTVTLLRGPSGWRLVLGS